MDDVGDEMCGLLVCFGVDGICFEDDVCMVFDCYCCCVVVMIVVVGWWGYCVWLLLCFEVFWLVVVVVFM